MLLNYPSDLSIHRGSHTDPGVLEEIQEAAALFQRPDLPRERDHADTTAGAQNSHRTEEQPPG